MIRVHKSILIAALCLGCSQLVCPESVQAEAPPTLWSFLGIPQALNHWHTQAFNRHGHLPGLEPKPPLRAIADPANLPAPAAPGASAGGPASSAAIAWTSVRNLEAAEPPPDPQKKAIETAAQIKQSEDLAPQKIKAIRYLATVGCGRPGVKEAFIASIDPAVEATEEVRYVAAQAILQSAGNPCCDHCNTASCCKKELLEKMGELAFRRDGQGCWLEPSDRVRETLQEALQKCCPGSLPIIEEGEPEPAPDDRKPVPDLPASERADESALPEMSKPKTPPAEGAAPAAAPNGTQNPSARSSGVEFQLTDFAEIWPASFAPTRSGRLLSPGPLVTALGTVLRVNPSDQTVEIRCPDQGRAVVGTVATVRRKFLIGVESIGTLKVVSADEGYLVAESHRLNRPLKEGDEVVVFMQGM